MSAVHDRQARSAIQKQFAKSSLLGVEPEPVRSYMSDDTKRSETMSAALDFPPPIKHLGKRSSPQLAKKAVETVQCDIFSMETVRDT